MSVYNEDQNGSYILKASPNGLVSLVVGGGSDANGSTWSGKPATDIEFQRIDQSLNNIPSNTDPFALDHNGNILITKTEVIQTKGIISKSNIHIIE